VNLPYVLESLAQTIGQPEQTWHNNYGKLFVALHSEILENKKIISLKIR
jgi:hypothetical protein